jgi:hypothetical protein
MKTISQLLILALLFLGSCTSALYTGAEYDDLYYLPSDRPVVSNKSAVNEQIAEGTLKGKDYYDNVYAADTLVSDEYSAAVDYDSQVDNSNYYSDRGYDYYDEFPYSSRLRMFYGNYFDPYWRDPYYYGFGYSGFPYYGYGSSWNPYYGYGGMYGDYYGGGYYSGLYGGYYGGYNSGYYGYYGGYRGGSSLFSTYPFGYSGVYLKNGGDNSINYARRDRPSTYSSKLDGNTSPSGSRRDSYLQTGNTRTGARTTGTQSVASDQRRTSSSGLNSQQSVNQVNRRSTQDQTNIRSNASGTRNAANTRPEYNSASRSYTPSYNNPRMSTRPSYNNSRVNEGVNSNVGRNSAVNNGRVYNNNPGTVRTPSNQGSNQNSYNNARTNSYSGSQRRSDAPSSGYSAPATQYRSNSSRSSESYSVPSRSGVERSSYSSGSSSGNSRSSSSYSSGSSSSRGSYSSGSSSSGSSSSGSSSGSSGSSSSGGGSSSGRR